MRESEEKVGSETGSKTEKMTNSVRDLGCLENTVRKRLYEQSIDYALNQLKGHCPTSAEPASPLREYTFYPDLISTPTTSCAQSSPRYRRLTRSFAF
jgi:hypothetical protein